MKSASSVLRWAMPVAFLVMVVAGLLNANDSTYYMSGNQLVPAQATDIALTREILTIDIGDDGMAHVDVYYELMNMGKARTVRMGFEADPPCCTGDYPASANGVHPEIEGFTVEMNGKNVPYKNALISSSLGEGDIYIDFKPLDKKQLLLSAKHRKPHPNSL